MDRQDLQQIFDKLDAQGQMIARVDERQLAMSKQLDAFSADVSVMKQEVQSVKETAFKNAVIVGGIGAGAGCVATIIVTKMIGA